MTKGVYNHGFGGARLPTQHLLSTRFLILSFLREIPWVPDIRPLAKDPMKLQHDGFWGEAARNRDSRRGVEVTKGPGIKGSAQSVAQLNPVWLQRVRRKMMTKGK